MRRVPFEPRETVQLALMGCGGRGRGLLRDLLAVEGVRVNVVFDIDAEPARKAQKMVEDAGGGRPDVRTDGNWDAVCARDDIDLVYIATPWRQHVPIAVAAMEAGKHAAVEVPAATTLDECWQLVDASERTRRHCVLLENCCYGENELLVRNMARAGVFGELTHAEAAYIHDLRGVLLSDGGEGLWRRAEHGTRNGNLYPTHGLGPVARYFGIHEGDRFTKLVSMSSREASLTEFRDKTLAPDDPKRGEAYACGDMNTSLIQTARGRTIVLQHDVVTPRPYDRANLIAGTRGAFRDFPARVYLDGQDGGEEWTTLDAYKQQFADPLWRDVGELARKLGGHGGMDFLMNYRLIQCLRDGLPPDSDVYDAAAWSAPGPLSEQSVASGSMPVEFPDFTRGHWQ